MLADFDGGFAAPYEGDREASPDEELWRIVGMHPDFFDALSPMRGALELFEAVRHLGAIILTACPQPLYERAVAGKTRWVGRILGPAVRIVPVRRGRNKPRHMTGHGDVLVDDWADNIAAWRAARGVGIHHTSPGDTLRALVECGILP